MSFSKTGVLREPFGKNEYRRSTKGLKYESYTTAADSVDAEEIDGYVQRILQSGEVIAKITSGKDAGKTGPFQTAGVDEVNTLTKSGTVSGGDYVVSHPDLEGDTGDILFNANTAAIQAAVDAWLEGQLDDEGDQIEILVSGGPLNTTPVVFTWVDDEGANRASFVVDASGLTGGGSAAFGETTPGAEGPTDGRGNTANIVGVQETFLPWELNERDHHSAVCYDGVLVQAWCFERNAAGQRIPLTDATRDAILANPALRLTFV